MTAPRSVGRIAGPAFRAAIAMLALLIAAPSGCGGGGREAERRVEHATAAAPVEHRHRAPSSGLDPHPGHAKPLRRGSFSIRISACAPFMPSPVGLSAHDTHPVLLATNARDSSAVFAS